MIRWRGIKIDRAARTITHKGKTLRLRPIQFRLVCALILGGPMRKETLFEHLYEDREDGGPDGWTRLIDVMLQHIKPKLCSIGLQLYADSAWYCQRKRFWVAPAPIAVEAAA